jgi:hypothetical protein
VYTRVSAIAGWIDRAAAAPVAAPALRAPGAPQVRALAVRARAGGLAQLRYRLLGTGQRTREDIVVRAGRKVLARLRTDAGPARADVEYQVAWRVPVAARRAGSLGFCVSTHVIGGPAGGTSCAPLELVAPRRRR